MKLFAGILSLGLMAASHGYSEEKVILSCAEITDSGAVVPRKTDITRIVRNSETGELTLISPNLFGHNALVEFKLLYSGFPLAHTSETNEIAANTAFYLAVGEANEQDLMVELTLPNPSTTSNAPSEGTFKFGDAWTQFPFSFGKYMFAKVRCYSSH